MVSYSLFQSVSMTDVHSWTKLKMQPFLWRRKKKFVTLHSKDLKDYEPIHVHVVKDGKEAKYNVSPEVKQVYNHGYKKHEISIIEGVIEENVEVIIDRWNNYFKQ